MACAGLIFPPPDTPFCSARWRAKKAPPLDDALFCSAAQTTNKHNYASNKIKQPYKIHK
jgi:hypothetical protein